jgi:hypothetical protein
VEVWRPSSCRCCCSVCSSMTTIAFQMPMSTPWYHA